MSYRETYGLKSDWWKSTKLSYVFDDAWFKAFEAINPRLKITDDHHPKSVYVDEAPTDMGIVFWHEPDGKTILPVGLVCRFGDQNVFCYHPEYARDPDTCAISKTLPKSQVLHENTDKDALLPFFDNLVSEGWLGHAQTNAYQTHHQYGRLSEEGFAKADNGRQRFERLVTFGTGFHGAVSVIDVTVTDLHLDREEREVRQALASRATLTGAQPKMLAIEDTDQDGTPVFRPAKRQETSTRIIKIGQSQYRNIVPNEYLNIVATRALIPNDPVNEANLSTMKTEHGETPVIVLDRFDRTPEGGRVHFEEALAMIGEIAKYKYSPTYKQLGQLTRELAGEEEVKRLFRRILAHWVLGNTDGHWKNFAFWNQNGKWELTPNYDLVSADEYANRENRANKGLPMRINGMRGERTKDIGEVDAKLVFDLGKALALPNDVIYLEVNAIKEHIPDAIAALRAVNDPLVDEKYKAQFIANLERRANGQYSTLERYWRHIASKENGNGRANGL